MRQFIIALDQLANTLFRGWADETISARAYRNSAQGHPRWSLIRRGIDALFFWQHSHCRGSYRMEQERLHMPPAYRATYNRGGSDAAG